LLSEDHSNSNKNNNNGKNRGRGQHQQEQEQEHNQDDNNGTWREIMCNSFLRKMYNQNGTTKCYLKWMKDSRGKSVPPAATTNAKSNNKKNNNNNKKNNSNRLYPCIIVFSTLDAPMDDVCAYLSDETRIPEYNEVVVKNLDLEHISPHSKICWGQSPQILFVKPRDFVTFCHHRWRKDGTQIVVNQAVNQDEYDFDASCFSDSHHNKGGPIEEDEEDNGNGNNNSGKPLPRAYALRGANFISPHPDDPKKTSFIFICHANPGGNIPQWASRTAVNAVAPIEPFKMIYRVNEGVKRSGRKIATQLAADARKNNNKKGRQNTNRSSKPAGLAQMGYACFWPNGGGKIE